MNKRRLVWNIAKYLLAFVLLAWVVLLNWAPPRHSWESLADIAGDTGQAVQLLWNGHGGSEAFDALTRTVREADPEKPGLAFILKRHFIEGAPVHWEYFLAALAICMAATLLTFVRWFLLVRAVGLPFTVPNALRLGMVGYFFNTFLPGSVGGDIVKAAFLAREQSRRTVAVATVLMDRVLALWAFVGFVAIAGTLFWALGWLDGPGMEASLWMTWGSAAAVIVSLIIWLLLGLLPQWRVDKFAWRLDNQVPKIGPALAEFWRAVWMYRCRQKTVALAMLMTWVAEVGFIFVFYFSVLTLWGPEYGPIPTLAEHLLLVPIGLVVMAIPIFPGGVGIGELGFGGLYSAMGCQPAFAVLGSLVQRVIMWSLAFMGLFVYQRMKPALQAAKPEEAAATPPAPGVVLPNPSCPSQTVPAPS